MSFDEELAIGYRYWDAHAQTPLFPFGYGLSYATSQSRRSTHGTAERRCQIRAHVTNDSARAGSEVLQAYVGFPAGAGEPPKQLKAFAKVALAPGQIRDVTLALDPRAFQIWDPARDRWTTPPGTFELMLGRSSRDIIGRWPIVPRGG